MLGYVMCIRELYGRGLGYGKFQHFFLMNMEYINLGTVIVRLHFSGFG